MQTPSAIRLRIFCVCFLIAPLVSRAELPKEMKKTFREYLKNSQHVVLVCVFQESMDKRTQPEKHHLHVDATVVRSIKGDLKVGEKIRYFSLFEGVPRNRASKKGDLNFLFLRDLPKGEFHLDTGSGWLYHPELDEIVNTTSN